MADDSDNAINAFKRDYLFDPTRDARWDEYKTSAAWRRLKKIALIRAGHKCQQCRTKRGLQMHHVRYPRDLEDDCLNNVTILCWRHHLEAHGLSPERSILNAR